MSYPAAPNAPGARRARPGTVTISSYLLYLVAALQVIGLIISLMVAGDYQRVFEDAYANVDGGDAIASVTSIFLIGGAILSLVLAAGLVVLAIFNNKGKNGSRITTWIIGGLFLCCSGFGAISTLAGGSMNFGGAPADPDMPSPEELQDMLNDALPSWFIPASAAISIITVVALLGVIILLALPPSNEFFRKPQQEWQPPVAGQPGYTAYPAYPPAGGPQGPGTPSGAPPSAAPPSAEGGPSAGGATPGAAGPAGGGDQPPSPPPSDQPRS